MIDFYPSDVAPLREISNVRQVDEDGFRRWFSNDYLDLIVWYDLGSKELVGFQICYDVGHKERALTWTYQGGYHHNKVDDGQAEAGSFMTPILVPDGTFNSTTIADIFLRASIGMEKELAEFIFGKIKEYGI